MLVAGPQRRLFLACLGVGITCLLLVDLWFAPAAITVSTEAENDAASFDASELAALRGDLGERGERDHAPPPAAPTVRGVVDPVTRVPTIVARFESESKEPADESAIRTLATVMIEDHSLHVVLEGHSDTRGGGDFNHEISLRRAEWVKSRLVELGVNADRIEAVGLGATRPLRSDIPDAQSVNRRVEIRWTGR